MTVATVVGIGKPKQDKYHNWFRWVRALADGKLVLMPIPERYFEKPLRTGDFVEFEYERSKQGNLTMLLGISAVRVVGHEVDRRTVNFDLTQMEFHDWGVSMRKPGFRALFLNEDWNVPDLEPSRMHEKVKTKLPLDEQKASFVEVQAAWDVYYNWDGSRNLYTRRGEVVKSNIVSLVRAVVAVDEARRWREARKEIKELLAQKRALMATDIDPILKKHGFAEDAEKVLKDLTWKDYDEEYWGFLKGLTDKPIGFTERGYYFEVQGKEGPMTVWEIPEHGSATYFFLGTMGEVLPKVLPFSKMDLLTAKAEPNEDSRKLMDDYLVSVAMGFFMGRVIHTDVDGWKRRVREALGSG